MHYPNAGTLLEDTKAHTYVSLHCLQVQGQAIPTFYGFYDMWGIFRLLVLEPVGNPISED
jgi:hypothetical protein